MTPQPLLGCFVEAVGAWANVAACVKQSRASKQQQRNQEPSHRKQTTSCSNANSKEKLRPQVNFQAASLDLSLGLDLDRARLVASDKQV